MNHSLRIIGGNWRRRKISFLPLKSLRPTPDRLRETLFNWLSPIISNKNCLDLFAGSGILGFESLSRGAKSVIFIDRSYQVIKQLQQTSQKLYQSSPTHTTTSFDLPTIKFFCQSAHHFLNTHPPDMKFDIIFIDPPFYHNLINQTIAIVEHKKWLNSPSYVYLEMEQSHPELILPNHWQILKKKSMGKISCHLILRETFL